MNFLNFDQFLLENSHNLTKQQVDWLNKYVTDLNNNHLEWSVDSSGKIIVSGNKIFITDPNIEQFPVYFAAMSINDDTVFNCDGCTSLKSLIGSPDSVYSFYCRNCTSLATLKGGPIRVGFNFSCENTGIKNLEYSPTMDEDGIFDCSECQDLISLKGAPRNIARFFISKCRSLDNLEYCPVFTNDLQCSNCDKIQSELEFLKRSNVINNAAWIKADKSPVFIKWIKEKRSWNALIHNIAVNTSFGL